MEKGGVERLRLFISVAMKIKSYQELFEYAAFPVLALDENGKVVYKNLSAKKYLPMIRKNALASKHFTMQSLPKESMAVELACHSHYKKAIALQDEDGFLIFSFPRLQYDDSVEIARILLSEIGKAPNEFFAALQNPANDAEEAVAGISRIYTDLLHVLRAEGELFQGSICALQEVTTALFEKLRFSFRALGYRIRTEIAPSFRKQYLACVEPRNFLFVFGRLLYLQMKHSQDGVIEISLSGEEDTRMHCLRIAAKTSLSSDALDVFSTKDVLQRMIPECAIELFVLEKTEMLEDANISFSWGEGGMLYAEYRIPYLEKPSYFVQSGARSTDLWDTDLSLMLTMIRKRLKDNGASC